MPRCDSQNVTSTNVVDVDVLLAELQKWMSDGLSGFDGPRTGSRVRISSSALVLGSCMGLFCSPASLKDSVEHTFRATHDYWRLKVGSCTSDVACRLASPSAAVNRLDQG